jgi:PHD/YefM family antitoxin component YafN of YafNO toxin-antitoxin module
MTIVSATDFKKHLGTFSDAALKEPVIIQKHERNSLALVAFDYLTKLQARVADLEDEKLLREIAKIKRDGEFVSGNEAIEQLKSMIV